MNDENVKRCTRDKMLIWVELRDDNPSRKTKSGHRDTHIPCSLGQNGTEGNPELPIPPPPLPLQTRNGLLIKVSPKVVLTVIIVRALPSRISNIPCVRRTEMEKPFPFAPAIFSEQKNFKYIRRALIAGDIVHAISPLLLCFTKRAKHGFFIRVVDVSTLNNLFCLFNRFVSVAVHYVRRFAGP